jgi:hypothetical protein
MHRIYDVATPIQAVDSDADEVALIAALMGGTAAMRKAGEAYLPKWPRETSEDYAARLAVAVLFPAFKRTVETLASKPFSKPLTIGNDVPPQITGWLDDIDQEGRNLHTFAHDLCARVMSDGLAGILIDYPALKNLPNGPPQNLAQEIAAGLRPYWVMIRKDQILGWRAERMGGKWSLNQLRIKELVQAPMGDYGEEAVEQIRVLSPGKWQTWRRNATNKTQWEMHANGDTSLKFVPFVPVYGKRVGYMLGESPLKELAYLNLSHFQSSSDQQTILHVARVPILAVSGADDGVSLDGKPEKWEFTVGTSGAVRLPLNGKIEFVEHSGAAIAAGVADIDAIEERMRQVGAELLVLAPGKTTATEVATQNSVGMCALQSIVLGMQDALNQSLSVTAQLAKIGNTGGTVTLFSDFAAASLQESSAAMLLNAVQGGQLSRETFLDELRRRGILGENVNSKDELDRIEAEGPKLGEMNGNEPVVQ